MGLILPRWGLILPRIPPPTPVLYSAVTRSAVTSDPTPKHPFSWPELESGQNELQSGQFGPQLGKMFEKWENFSRSGQKKIIHVRYVRFECALGVTLGLLPRVFFEKAISCKSKSGSK